MHYVVRSPEPTYLGKVGSLSFVDGRAVADDSVHVAELAYCRSSGYAVTELVPEVAEAAPESPVMPRKSASTEAWQAYAVAQGMTAEEAAAMSRTELVERFAPAGNGGTDE